MKKDLQSLQQWFKWAVTGLGTEPIPGFEAELFETKAFDKEARLEVYEYAYKARLIESLEDDFEKVKQVIGEERFTEIADAYFDKHPSIFKSLTSAGKFFPGFIKKHSLVKEFAFLPDLAAIEWSQIVATFTEESPKLSPDAVGAFPKEAWPSAVLKLGESATLLTSTWDLEEVWKNPEGSSQNKKESFVVVYKPEGFGDVEFVTKTQMHVLQEIKAGKNLEQICESLVDVITEGEEPDLMTWFSQWVSKGLIRSIGTA